MPVHARNACIQTCKRLTAIGRQIVQDALHVLAHGLHVADEDRGNVLADHGEESRRRVCPGDRCVLELVELLLRCVGATGDLAKAAGQLLVLDALVYPAIEQREPGADRRQPDQERREANGQSCDLLAETTKATFRHLGDLNDLKTLLNEDGHGLLPSEQALRDVGQLEGDILQRAAVATSGTGHPIMPLRYDRCSIRQHALSASEILGGCTSGGHHAASLGDLAVKPFLSSCSGIQHSAKLRQRCGIALGRGILLPHRCNATASRSFEHVIREGGRTQLLLFDGERVLRGDVLFRLHRSHAFPHAGLEHIIRQAGRSQLLFLCSQCAFRECGLLGFQRDDAVANACFEHGMSEASGPKDLLLLGSCLSDAARGIFLSLSDTFCRKLALARCDEQPIGEVGIALLIGSERHRLDLGSAHLVLGFRHSIGVIHGRCPARSA